MKSNYSGLWMLLVVALLAFFSFAFYDDVTIAGHTLKKAPFAETLFPESDGSVDSVTAEIPTDSVAVEVEEKMVEVDTVPKSILLFGDSMTLNLAIRLAAYAAYNGHTFHAVNWDSSNTKIWAESDTLDYYLRKYDVDYVFVSLGSNELYFKKPQSRLPYVRKILAKIGDIPYVWIGPPNWKEDTGINDMLQSACMRGSFFRSEGMNFKRKADNIHPTRSSSALWMDSIMRWMPESAHPILAVAPPDTIGKVKTHVVFLKALNK